jgi:hypothetical protein
LEDDFYATIKLKTGEEIFAIASSVQENGKDLLMISTPIILSEIKSRTGMTGYKVEPWLKTTSEDIFILNMNDVITISESKDVEIITMHQSYLRSRDNIKNKKTTLSRKMGYIANVNDAKVILENLFNKS